MSDAIDADLSPAQYLLRDNIEMEKELRARCKQPDWSVSREMMLATLLADEVCTIAPLKADAAPDIGYPIFSVCVMEYDFFTPAYTAYQPISNSDIADLYRFYEKDPENGRDAWLCKFHKAVPWQRMRERIEAGGIWDCDELAAREATP